MLEVEIDYCPSCGDTLSEQMPQTKGELLAREGRIRFDTRVAVLEEVWSNLKKIPTIQVEGFKFDLVNKRQVLGNVNEMLSKVRGEKK